MDDDFVLDIDEIKKNIDAAEIMSLFFPTFRKAVVMIRLMSMAASPQERLRSIRRLRSGFPRVHSLTLIPWTRYVDSLVSLGIWDRIVQRFRDAGQAEAVETCEKVLSELRRLEKDEFAAVVRGENYHTIWSARD